MLIRFAGTVIFPLADPIKDHYVPAKPSVASGAGQIAGLLLGMIIFGLVLRIYKNLSGGVWQITWREAGTYRTFN